MGDIVTCAEVKSQGSFATECNFQAFFTLWFGAACLARFDRNEGRPHSMSNGLFRLHAMLCARRQRQEDVKHADDTLPNSVRHVCATSQCRQRHRVMAMDTILVVNAGSSS